MCLVSRLAFLICMSAASASAWWGTEVDGLKFNRNYFRIHSVHRCSLNTFVALVMGLLGQQNRPLTVPSCSQWSNFLNAVADSQPLCHNFPVHWVSKSMLPAEPSYLTLRIEPTTLPLQTCSETSLDHFRRECLESAANPSFQHQRLTESREFSTTHTI